MIPRELFKKIRRVEVRTKGLVENLFGGEYHSAFRGRGIEFAEVRPYQVGDDVRAIDWNVTARTGEPYVKLFEEEREQTLLLVVDVSGSEDFGSHGAVKRDLAAEVCALLAFSALRNNDKVGLLLFTDRVERFVPPKKGRRHALRLVRDLFAHRPAHRGTRLGSALDHARRVLRRRAIVVVVSDFLDAQLLTGAFTFEQPLRALAQKHDVVAVRLLDERETALPPVGLLALTDAETGRPVLVDTSSPRVREAFADRAAVRERSLHAALRRARVDTVTVRTGEDYAVPLAAFFRRRNREDR
ncbi:MAG TPA: DUF58 domain-containing protein [Rubricoccaceae bacterium]|nr:DUF58 domain-containing protein [Rubricoccaceae bacterium]